MTPYEHSAQQELLLWQHKIQKKPSFANKLAKNIQTRINSYIPEKVHKAITVTIQKMVEGVLFGAKYINTSIKTEGSLQLRESHVRERTEFYRNTASAEGAITGAGGILLSFADFPLLIGIKLKLLFEIAALYGYDVKNYKERVYILYIFQLAFSSQQGRNEVYKHIQNWQGYSNTLPDDVSEFRSEERRVGKECR